jgi:hypothetical protein
MSISTDDVEPLRSMLIAAVASEIAAAQRRGSPAGELAQLLSEKGIDANGPMLGHDLRKIRNPEVDPQRRRPRRARRRQTDRVEPTTAISA